MSEPLAIDVRRATPADTEAVLSFTRRTWDGWDYIPEVWQGWLVASDGVVLVATPRDGNARHELDRFGRPLEPGRPIAIARVTLLAEGEAWLEGMRVDPGVRGRSVATALQEACLYWAAAQGATVVRYLTGESNEGSHRLGVRHGFRMLQPWRGFSVPDEPDPEEAAEPVEDVNPEDEGGVVESAETELAPSSEAEIREAEAERALQAEDIAPTDSPDEALPGPGVAHVAAGDDDAHGGTRRGEAGGLRSALAGTGLLPPARGSDAGIGLLWERIASDPTFAAADGLYEGRAWAFQSLTRERLAAHAAAGEVLVAGSDDAWAAAIVSLRPLLSEDRDPFIGLLVGNAAAALELLERLRAAVPRLPRLRLPDSLPLFGGDAEPLLRLGLREGEHTSHVFERSLVGDNASLAVSPPGMLRLAESPRRLARPPEIVA